MTRTVFVISDLHLGGEMPSPGRPRGFRMCSQTAALAAFIKDLPRRAGGVCELIINGDFVDFLAESHDGEYTPFIDDPATAETTFRNIVASNANVFRELHDFVCAGNRLTVLSGNHDIELSYPRVQTALREVLGRSDGCVRLLNDGRPLRLTNAVIEHGHLHDEWNRVTPAQLIDLIDHAQKDAVPPGSRLVSSVMNRVKETFAFVDLLKPEQETAVPVVLALDRSQLLNVGRILLLAAEARGIKRNIDAERGFVPVSAVEGEADTAAPDAAEAVAALLEQLMPGRATDFVEDIKEEAHEMVQIADLTPSEVLSAIQALSSSPRRHRALYRALHVAQRDLSFILDFEQDKRYRAACVSHDKSVELVVMGHTHLAKDVANLGRPGRRYINTGTWADIIPFPDLFGDDESEGVARCKEFVADLEAGLDEPSRLERWIAFRPYYCRLDCDGDTVRAASLELFGERAREPSQQLAPHRSWLGRPSE